MAASIASGSRWSRRNALDDPSPKAEVVVCRRNDARCHRVREIFTCRSERSQWGPRTLSLPRGKRRGTPHPGPRRYCGPRSLALAGQRQVVFGQAICLKYRRNRGRVRKYRRVADTATPKVPLKKPPVAKSASSSPQALIANSAIADHQAHFLRCNRPVAVAAVPMPNK